MVSRSFGGGEAVEELGEGVEEGALVEVGGDREHEPGEFARGCGGGGAPAPADGAVAYVVGEGVEVCGDCVEELRRKVRPVNGGR